VRFKRAVLPRLLVTPIALVTLVVACAGEEKQNQTLHPYSGGPPDSGAEAATVVDSGETVDTGTPIADTGTDTTPAFVDTYISDLPFTEVANGYGPVEKDTSNGEDAANDGVTMMIETVMYTKGLGVHANSQVTRRRRRHGALQQQHDDGQRRREDGQRRRHGEEHPRSLRRRRRRRERVRPRRLGQRKAPQIAES
jgi:hypothetical protein